ncbi:hypothetical protein BH11PSE2_BH11PSE2_14670 [soil metagenome]
MPWIAKPPPKPAAPHTAGNADRATALAEKIAALPAERITQVEDFVDFLAQSASRKS